MKILIDILSDSFNTSTRGLKLHIEEFSDDDDNISLQVCAWSGSILNFEIQGALLCISKDELRKIVRNIRISENSIVFITPNTLAGGEIAFDGHQEQLGDTEKRRKVIDIAFCDLGGDLAGKEIVKVRRITIHFDVFYAAMAALL